MFKKSDIILPLVAAITLAILWQVVTTLMNIPSYIMPSPLQIWNSYWGAGEELSKNFGITLLESSLGMVTGSVFGFLVGLSMGQSRVFQKISLPFLIASNAVPVIALAPVIIIWFGNTLLAKVMVSAFISFFPVVLNTHRGLIEYKKCFFELFQIYGATEKQFLFKYKLRNALPYIFTGLKLNATMSVIGAIIGEFVSSDRGLGFGILQASYNFDSARLWLYIFLACSIGISFYSAIYVIEKIFFHKFKNN